jgi:hypothetical protein
MRLIIAAILFSASFTAMACGGSQGAKPTATNRAERMEDKTAEQASKVPGSYQCTLEVGDSTVGPGSCSVTKGGAAYEIQLSVDGYVLSGKGEITDAGFTFSGDYTCPDGADCQQTVDGEFFEQAEGYTGSVATEAGLVHITFAPQ